MLPTAYRSFLIIFSATLMAGVCGAAEEKIKSEELPNAVTEALRVRFPDLKITSAAKETNSAGKTVYDVELKSKNRKFETDIKEDGTMLEVEKEVSPKHWMPALTSTVQAKYPSAKIKEVMEVCKVNGKEEIPDHFEITVETADKKSAELLTTLSGKAMKEEKDEEAATSAGDENIKVDELPKAVQDSLRAKFPKAEITGAEKGTEDGQKIYEASIKSENHNIDVTLTPDGKILSFEKTISASERPKTMAEALNAKYPHATIKLVEEVWENDKLTGYEATIVTPDKKTHEVDFDSSGKLATNDKK
jgi:uncharacterized membrane protein YkoI